MTKHAFQLFFFCIMGLVLAGCGGSATITNGQNLANLSGKANTPKTYTLKIPDNTFGLMIQAAGSADISLDLLDANGNSLGACAQPLRCMMEYPLPGTYKLQLSATADYTGVNLSASWGGPGVSVLQNSVAIDGLKGDASTVMLKSLYIDSDQHALVLDATSASPITVRLLDRFGNEHWFCGSNACMVHYAPAGLYYVQLKASAPYENVRLRAGWGESADATLENGDVLTGLSGTAGTQFIESIYIPPGVDSLAMITNSQHMQLDLIPADDGPRWLRCEQNPVAGTDCIFSELSPGLHYVVGTLMHNAADVSIALRFGGASFSTLISGQPGAPRPAIAGDLHLETFFVPEGVTSAVFDASMNAGARIYDSHGQLICQAQPCAMSNLSPGSYFVRLDTYSDWTPFINTAFALGGAGHATLAAGQPKSITPHFAHERFVESIQIDAGVDAFAIAITADDVYISVSDPNGLYLPGCGSQGICIVRTTTPGSYFVSYEFAGPITAGQTATISLAVGGEGFATVQNGEPTSPRPAQSGALHLESFFVAPGVDSAVFTTSMNSEARIYAADGRVVCEYQPCFMQNLQPGAYFAAIKVWDSTWIQQINASLALGGPEHSTLASGQRKEKIIEFRGESGFESFYAEPGVESFILAASNTQALMAVHNARGDVVAECWNRVDCIARVPSPGTYYVRYEHNEMTESNPSYTIALALGSEQGSTLLNGQPSDPVAVVTGDILMESFYLPEGATSAAFTTQMNSEARIYAADGRLVCEHQPCVMTNLPPGAYFAVIRVWDSWIPYVSASLALGGSGQATLNNGQTKAGTLRFNGESGVESFYAGTGADSFAIAASSEGILAYVVNSQGEQVADCWNRSHCIGRITSPGTYFVHYEYYNPDVDPQGQSYSISLALGGESVATLKADEVQAPRNAQPGDTLVQSIHRESVQAITAVAVSHNAWTRIYDVNGNQRCEGWFCVLEGLPAGSYFVISTTMDHPYLTSVSSAVTHGGPGKSDLLNGQTLFGLQGMPGAFILKSIFVTADSQSAYHPQSLQVWQNPPSMMMNIIDQYGTQLKTCLPTDGCQVSGLFGQQYYVLLEVLPVIPGTAGTVSAAWVGPGTSSLENGVTYTLDTPAAEFVSAQSFNLESASAVQFTSDSNAVEAVILNDNSQLQMYCSGGACDSVTLPPGSYFLKIATAPYLPYSSGSIQYSLSW